MRLMITPRKKIADTGRKCGELRGVTGSAGLVGCQKCWKLVNLQVRVLSCWGRISKDFQVSTSGPPRRFEGNGMFCPFFTTGVVVRYLQQDGVKHRYTVVASHRWICELGVAKTKVDLYKLVKNSPCENVIFRGPEHRPDQSLQVKQISGVFVQMGSCL